VALYPAHELLDVGGGRHLGGALVGLIVLPEVLESVRVGSWVVSGLFLPIFAANTRPLGI
jgi:hypothetical protein